MNDSNNSTTVAQSQKAKIDMINRFEQSCDDANTLDDLVKLSYRLKKLSTEYNADCLVDVYGKLVKRIRTGFSMIITLI